MIRHATKVARAAKKQDAERRVERMAHGLYPIEFYINTIDVEFPLVYFVGGDDIVGFLHVGRLGTWHNPEIVPQYTQNLLCHYPNKYTDSKKNFGEWVAKCHTVDPEYHGKFGENVDSDFDRVLWRLLYSCSVDIEVGPVVCYRVPTLMTLRLYGNYKYINSRTIIQHKIDAYSEYSHQGGMTAQCIDYEPDWVRAVRI